MREPVPGVPDLSPQASEERGREAKLRAAAHQARTMARIFKGITRLNRREYARLALEEQGLIDRKDRRGA